jgi:hypothetical protein
MLEKIIEQLKAEMPPLITRGHPKFKVWTGISGRRMANLDCLGKGPAQRVLLGREVAYPRESLLQWIAGRLSGAKGDSANANFSKQSSMQNLLHENKRNTVV